MATAGRASGSATRQNTPRRPDAERPRHVHQVRACIRNIARVVR
jgi:hypothetical protein